MEIKTTKEIQLLNNRIIGELNNELNKKWVAVDDVIKLWNDWNNQHKDFSEITKEFEELK